MSIDGTPATSADQLSPPPCWVTSGRTGSPAAEAHASSSAELVGPIALTYPSGWWTQTTTSGSTCSTSVASACVSGSDSGAGPPSPGRQCHGKLRLRSAPLELQLIPAAEPSGLARGTRDITWAG